MIDRALTYYKTLRRARHREFDVRNSNFHYDAFTPFAETIVGDMARKLRAHLFPKVDAAGDEGLRHGDLTVVPTRSADGTLHGCDILEGGKTAFRITSLHTREGATRPASDTVSVYRAGATRSIAHATLHAPDERHREWRYKVYDGPGAIPGIVEACRMVIPFVREEVGADKASDTLSWSRLPECAALIDADGGLPGDNVSRFGESVLEDGSALIGEWLARAMPEVVNRLGDRVTWPDNSLVYNDNGEHSCVIRSLLSVGMVHFMPLRDETAKASITILRIDPEGEPVSFENHLVGFGDGAVTRSIEDYREGLPILGHPHMIYDFASGRVETTAEYLEARHYVSFALPVDQCTIDWRGRRDEGILAGVGAFLEEDGVGDGAVPLHARGPMA